MVDKPAEEGPVADEGSRVAKVVIENVRKSYGDTVVAVDDVSLSVRDGEFVSLLGPSGSGKTTTLSMVAGFVLPDRGRVWIDGTEVTMLPPAKRGIGFVFQRYALFPKMTVQQNVEFPLRMRKVPAAERRRRASEALDRVRLAGYANRYPAELSGGQQQRTALARAFVFQPSILLMDEPLGALDKKLRSELQREIHSLCKDLGATVLYVTHDQEEALAMSDRVAIFRDGRIAQLGVGEDLYRRPCDPFVAEFMGECNRFDATVAGASTVACADGIFTDVTHLQRAVSGRDTRVVAMVRPENLCVEHTDDDITPTGTLSGTVQAVTYLGTDYRVEVRLGSGKVVTATLAVSTDRAPFTPGDAVQVSPRDGASVMLFDPPPAGGGGPEVRK